MGWRFIRGAFLAASGFGGELGGFGAVQTQRGRRWQELPLAFTFC